MSKYRWVYADRADYAPNGRLYDVGILADGTLHNPRGYPDNVVRAAVLAADERCRARRSEAAKKAAVTRQRRQERAIRATARKIMAGCGVKAGTHCTICGKGLDDPQSIERGIGSDCWQRILQAIEQMKQVVAAEQEPAP